MNWKDRADLFRFPGLLIAGLVFISINTLFLPHGISWLLLLGIVLLPFTLYQAGILRIIVFLLLVQYLIVSLTYDPQPHYFFRSSLLFLSFSALAIQADKALRANNFRWSGSSTSLCVFADLVSAGHAFLLMVYGFLWFSPWKDLVWWTFFLSPSVGDFTRLKGLSYEPSYYALMLAPFFLFQLSKFLQGDRSRKRLFLLFSLGSGLFVSFSMGVLGSLFLSMGIALIFLRQSKVFVWKLPDEWPWICAGISALFICSWLIFPDAALFLRLGDILSGKDLSANNRLFESFLLAGNILGTDRIWFGLGPGQLKVEGYFFIKSFYNYQWNDSWAPSMPNSVSDWLCTFGLFGVFFKFYLLFRLFRCRATGKDLFRFLCFAFIFIYQFTGGYLFCLPELLLWVLAFAGPSEKKPVLRNSVC